MISSLCILALCLAVGAAGATDCGAASASLASSLRIQSDEKSITFTDRSEFDFHVTGILQDGTLTVSVFRALNNGARMEGNLSQILDQIVAHFPDALAVELKLSQKDRITNETVSSDPLLESFETEWRKHGKNGKISDEERLYLTVKALTELKQIAIALGGKVQLSLTSYTHRTVPGRNGDRSEPGFLKLGVRFERPDPRSRTSP